MAVIKYRDSNNQWQVIAGGGGGGSDLPTPTSSDVGKVLMVVQTAVDGDSIVPSQSITLDNNARANLTNVDMTEVAANVPCIIHLDSDTYTATIDVDWYLDFGEAYSIDFNSSPPKITDDDGSQGDQHTISVFTATTAYEWQAVALPDANGVNL